ncbi:hypothetical protein DFJ77DRAFT_461859 [Powellomyces hirtus]|nr:hypothetical protein DFJ77DRAFT_461859 [Powellomyces hirtus]
MLRPRNIRSVALCRGSLVRAIPRAVRPAAAHLSTEAPLENLEQVEQPQKRENLEQVEQPQKMESKEEYKEHKQPYGWDTLSLSKPFNIPAPPVPKATHNILTATLKLTTHMPDHLPLLLYFARHSAHCMSLPASDPIHFPVNTKKFYVVKGPFVHAKTKEVFEEKKFSGAVQIFDGNTETIKEWIEYVTRNMPSGVDVGVERFVWEPLRYETVPQIDANLGDATTTVETIPTANNTLSFEERVRTKAAKLVSSWDPKVVEAKKAKRAEKAAAKSKNSKAKKTEAKKPDAKQPEKAK